MTVVTTVVAVEAGRVMVEPAFVTVVPGATVVMVLVTVEAGTTDVVRMITVVGTVTALTNVVVVVIVWVDTDVVPGRVKVVVSVIKEVLAGSVNVESDWVMVCGG